MVSNHHGWAERRVRALVGVAVLGVVAGCSDATGTGDPSTFSADVSGARSGRLTGTATAGGDASREVVVQATLPGVGAVTAIALSANDGANVISFTREGSDLPVGTYSLGPDVLPRVFSGAYVVRRPDGWQVFLAESGTLTISQTGTRVSGTFTLNASKYSVIPKPKPEDAGKPITPISTGSEQVAITGSFEATRR
jgi:hypothetical protein